MGHSWALIWTGVACTPYEDGPLVLAEAADRFLIGHSDAADALLADGDDIIEVILAASPDAFDPDALEARTGWALRPDGRPRPCTTPPVWLDDGQVDATRYTGVAVVAPMWDGLTAACEITEPLPPCDSSQVMVVLPMGHDDVDTARRYLEERLRWWDDSPSVRAVVAHPTAEVVRFVEREDPYAVTQLGVFLCLPWQAAYHAAGIELTHDPQQLR